MFSQRTYGFWLGDFFGFLSINMANDCFIAIEMVQAIKKIIIKGNCEASLDEKGRDKLKLSSPNETF